VRTGPVGEGLACLSITRVSGIRIKVASLFCRVVDSARLPSVALLIIRLDDLGRVSNWKRKMPFIEIIIGFRFLAPASLLC